MSGSFTLPESAPAGMTPGAAVSGVDVVVDEDGNFYARELVFGAQSEAFGSGGQFGTEEDAAAMAFAVYQAYLRGVVGHVGPSVGDLLKSLRVRFGVR